MENYRKEQLESGDSLLQGLHPTWSLPSDWLELAYIIILETSKFKADDKMR